MIDGQCRAICFGVADVALFIVDPIAVVPAYLVITNDEAAEDQRRTAKRACIVMTILNFLRDGNLLFGAFAITLPAFRTAGGLIL
ncbi:MAG TPA: MarC family protein [Candidatus Binatia bacterium]|nr:MarC family protein [Candidatus Binatia bacterium]